MTVQNYFLPQSVDEALGLLTEHGSSLVLLAGGTITMPLINEGMAMPDNVMSLQRTGLDHVKQNSGIVTVGATTTLSRISKCNISLLRDAARSVGGPAVRNLATVGGNLFCPMGDVATALLALDAQVKLVSKSGERILPLGEFFTGFMANALEAGELLSEIEIPAPTGKTGFVKYGRRHANTPAIVSVAAHLDIDGKKVAAARIALNAVGLHPLRATGAEEVLNGTVLTEASIDAAASAAAEACEPLDDAIAPEWYRRKMARVYVRRTLAQIAG